MNLTKATVCWLFLALVCALAPVHAQEAAVVTIRIPRVSTPPKIDDFLGMEPNAAWKDKLAKVDHFTQRIPSDGAPVSQRTEAYLGYDDKNLYVIFVCFDSEPDKLRARLSRREDIFDDDTVELILDTFRDHRHAYALTSTLSACNRTRFGPKAQAWDRMTTLISRSTRYGTQQES